MEKLDIWLNDALTCGIYGMRRFARTLRQDIAAEHRHPRRSARAPLYKSATPANWRRRHILQRYLRGPGAFGGLARMKNAAITTRGTATILPAAKMVENDSPIRSRNGPMPNAATP